MAHHFYADVAELADALESGSSVFTDVGVRVPSSASPIILCGSSSVVEHHLAKVGVAGSNPVFRFNHPIQVGGIGRHTGYAPVAQLDRAFDYGSKG